MKINLFFLLPLLADFTGSIINSILINHAKETLNFSHTNIGWIISIYGLCYIALPPLMGKYIEQLSKRKSLIIATLGLILNSFFYLLIINIFIDYFFELIIISQVIRAFSFTFYWATIETLLSENSENSDIEHEKEFRSFCISWGIGYMIGFPIGGFFSDYNLNFGIIIVSILYLMAFFIVVKKIPPNNQGEQEDLLISIKLENKNKKNSQKINLSLEVIVLLFTTLIFGMSTMGFSGYFLDYALDPDGLNWSATFSGILLLIFGFGQFSAFFFSKYIKKKIVNLFNSILIIGCIFLSLIWLESEIIIALVLFLAGYCLGNIYFLSLELTMKLEKENKGSKAGLFEGTIGLGFGLTPIFAGFIADFALFLPFLIFAIICLSFYIYTQFILNKEKRFVPIINKILA